jgi:hypothetical protein
MRSAEGVPGTQPPAGKKTGPGARTVRDTPMLVVAAAAVAAEAAGLLVAVILNAIDSASGRVYTASNAAAFIVLEVIVAAGVAAIASGIVRLRPWSRTPAVMTQVLTAVIAIALLDAHRYGWAVPALLLAIAGLAGLLAPASLRALARQPG